MILVCHRGLKFKAPDTSSELVPSNPFAERPSTAQQNAQTKLLLEAALDELDKPANMPEGLDPTVWQRLCNYRRAKIESENMVNICWISSVYNYDLSIYIFMT